MLKQVYEKIKSEYGTEQMNMNALFGSAMFILFIIMLEFMVRGTDIEIIVYIGKYLQVLLSVGAIGIALGVMFYKKKKKNNIILQVSLSVLVIIFLVAIVVLLLPIVAFFRIKETIEVISKISLSELKVQVTMISLVITSFIGGILLFVYLVLMPYYLNELEVDYLIALSSLVSVIIVYGLTTRIAYWLTIAFTKNINSKRRVIGAYYQDYKEKNIILYVIMLILTIYLFSQKESNQVIGAYINSITTIVLFDTLKDKWKSRLYRKEEEFEVIQVIYFDMRVIGKEIYNAYYINRNCRLRIGPVKNIDFITFMDYTCRKSSNKKFRCIIEGYNELRSDFIMYEEFNKKVYELEKKLIKFKIKHE